MPGIPDSNTAFSVSGQAILITLSGGSAVFVLAIAAFSLIHRFDIWPRVYSPRWYLYPNRTPMVHQRHGRFLFSWVRDIYAIPEDEILRTVGLDALVFLRTQRLYAFLFLLCSVFGLGVLVPLNIKYGQPATNDHSKFALTTMADLPVRKNIGNVHVYRTNIAATWLFTAFAVGLLWLEYRSYIALRFKWLTLPRTHNYSVMVTHIPPKMRNVAVLKAFFDRLLAPHGPQLGESIGKVLSVTLTMNLSRLEALVNERAHVHRKLYHLLTLYARPEDKICLRWLRGNREKWRADLKHDIRLLSERLQILNEVVECAQQEVRRLYYGYNDPSNFGLLDIEVVPSTAAGAGGRYLPGKDASEASEEGASPMGGPGGVGVGGGGPYSPPLTPKSDIIHHHYQQHQQQSLPSGGQQQQRPVSLPMRYTQPHQPIPLHPPPGSGAPFAPARASLPPRPLTPQTPRSGWGRGPAAPPQREIVEQQRVQTPVGAEAGAEDEEEGKAGVVVGGQGEGEGVPQTGQEEDGDGDGDIDVDGIDIHPPAPFQLEPSGGPPDRRQSPTNAAAGTPQPAANGHGSTTAAAVAAAAAAATTEPTGPRPPLLPTPRSASTPHAHLAAAPAARGDKKGEEEELALAGLGILLNKEGRLVDAGGPTPSEEARILQHQYHPTHRRGGVGAAGGAADAVYGYGLGARGEGGDYGSFSPSTIPVDDRRPQISARSKAVLEQFFRKPISSEIYGTAFVTVSTLEATAILRQTVTYQRAFEIIVEEAPLPEDILWRNIDINFVTNYLRTAIGHLLTLSITLAFTFPTAFISALNSVETLKKKYKFVRDWLPAMTEADSMRLNKILALVAPLLLLILLSIIPPIFGVLTRRLIKDSRTVSESHYHIYKRYFGFLCYNALFVFIVTTSIMETVKRAYDKPIEILNQIGATLPKPAAFFINFIIIKALTGLPSELMRVTSYLQHLVKIVFVDEMTEMNRAQVVIGCRSVTHPGGFHYGKFLAEHTLLYVYAMCYSCLAPLILPAGFIFFAGSYLVYKRQLLFVYEPEYETGGKMFKLILRYTFVGLFVAQFVMFVMLVTKQAFEDMPFFLPLPILTYFAKDLVSKWYGRLENHVPLSLAVAKDVRFWRGPGRIPASRSGEILDLSKDTFHHPAVRAPWCELAPPLAGWGSFEVLREGSSARHGAGAYERIRDEGSYAAKAGASGPGGATAINIGTERK